MDDWTLLDAHNVAVLERVNASGEIYLSHAKVRGSIALRLACKTWAGMPKISMT